MNPRRLIGYLLLNILVSAIVAGTVIVYFTRSHPVICPTPLANAAALTPGVGDNNVNIVGVIGVGTIGEERMVIQNIGAGELLLTGWTLADNNGLAYTFPELMLSSGATVQVHSASGIDTPTDLYWSRPEPIWKSGELAALFDTHGNARTFYRVP
jgi:hypothetical protein